jgi:hypothetical protein
MWAWMEPSWCSKPSEQEKHAWLRHCCQADKHRGPRNGQRR